MDLRQVNDGITDATEAIQSLLDQQGPIEVYLPAGRYRITSTLKIHSNTYLRADYNAVLFLCGDTPKDSSSFLLANDQSCGECENIRIDGGIWDGNNQGKYNTKGDIHNLDEYSGSVLNFFGVSRLELTNMVIANSVTYNIRMARIQNFKIENISFISDQFGFNQDGLHFNGNCKNGVIRNIRALSNGQTNDDLIALNADDEMRRVENVGMERGDIENLLIENVYAQNCHTLVRMLSVDHSIRNVTLRNIYGGYRCYAINADAARYCKTPLFDDRDFPQGVGNIENVVVDGFTCFTDQENEAIILESNCKNFTIKNFCLLSNHVPALKIQNIAAADLVADEIHYLITGKQDQLEIRQFHDLTIVQKADAIEVK